MLRLEEIDGGNWRIKLDVSPDQKRYVANSTTILARAYAYRKERAKAYFLCNGETYVGMVLYHDGEDAYVFSELFIGEHHQHRGYGTEAVRMVLDAVRQDGKFKKVILCYIEGNEGARKLYEKFGFRETDRDEDEIIMELEF